MDSFSKSKDDNKKILIVYTCPNCGEDLQEICLPTYPPQYRKVCFKCGWTETSQEQEEIIRVPYIFKESKVNNIPLACRYCSSHPSNGGSGICNCILGLPQITC